MHHRHLLITFALSFSTLLHVQYGEAEVIWGNFPGVMNDARFADLDQDGNLDMVCAAPYLQAVMWYRSLGNGQYLPGQAAIPGITAARSLAITDVDGDGVEDLVVAAGVQNGLLVALNNGFGEFTVATVTSDLQEPAFVRAADLNGDGLVDLVVASPADGRIDLFPGLGDGSFATAVTISSTAAGVDLLDLADVDNDGDLDLLAMMPTTQTLAWFANDGDGTFGTANTISAALPQLLTAAFHDLNGDGITDVLVSYGSDDLVWFAGQGGGSFSAVNPIAIINALRGAWAADLDDDGDLDLITGHQSAGRIYLNDGSGTFGQYDPGFPISGENAITQDIDGDGRIDLCFRRQPFQDVSYRLNQGALVFGPQVVVPPFHRAFRLESLDLEGDGDLDLIMTQGPSAPVICFEQVGPGTFQPGQEMSMGGTAISNFTLQDLDQDGALDLLFLAGSTVTRDLYWKRNEGGTFGPETLLQEIYLPDNYLITLADVDGDGDLDHVVSSPNVGWRRNDGGTFSAHIPVDASITLGPVIMADLNGDGLPDMVAANRSSTVARWYRNTGNATFVAQPNLPINLSFASELHAADLDGDGDMDLVLNGSNNAIAVLLNNGNGSFAQPQSLNTQNWTSIMHLHDVDGDGDLDLMNGNYTQFRWFANNGVGQFGDLNTLQPTEPYSTELNASIVVDLDGDGLKDIVYAEDQDPQLEWLNNRQNSFFRIQGRLYWDLDQDGVRDANDPPVTWATVTAAPAPNFPFSTNNGVYQAYVDAGTFTVRPVFDTTLWRITSDSLQYTVSPSANEPVSAGHDFGLFVNNANSVIDLGFLPPNGVCADTVTHWLSATNLGTFGEGGIIALAMDTLFTLLGAVPPADSVANGIHYWSYADLGFYSTFTVQLTTIRPDFTAIGDSTRFTVQAFQYDPFLPGSIVDTTALQVEGIVVCSYDPNDKLADPVGFGEFGAVDISTEHIDYTIRYQNTGNAPAVTVVLRDTLPLEADLGRLTLLGHSFAPTDLRVDSGRVFTARLQNILLPDSASDPLGSQGFLSFRMGLLPGLPHLTAITNSAGIYFDLNPPIITNTTLNTLVDCALWLPQIQAVEADVLSATEGLRYRWFLNDEALAGGDQQSITALANGNYRVDVTSVYGCVASAEYLFLSTGLQQQGERSFGIAPNPATGHTVLWGSIPWSEAHRITLLDAQGRSVLSTQGNGRHRVDLPLPGIAAGVYVLSITGPEGVRESVRVVVEGR